MGGLAGWEDSLTKASETSYSAFSNSYLHLAPPLCSEKLKIKYGILYLPGTVLNFSANFVLLYLGVGKLFTRVRVGLNISIRSLLYTEGGLT